MEGSGSQHLKYSLPRIWTFPGIRIDSSDESANAQQSIWANAEFDSNEIDASDRRNEKHICRRISTVRGIIIDSRDEDEKAGD
jgi:hypothetical protein